MKNCNIYICLFFLSLIFPFQAQNLKEGHWYGDFKLQEKHQLFFHFSVDGMQNMTIHNDKENVEMQSFEKVNDSIRVYFSSFPNYLIFKINKDNPHKIKGFFVNPARKSNGRVAFIAEYFGKEVENLPNNQSTHKNIAGKWQTTFNAETNNAYPAIGIFKQNEDLIRGTFLTETGDYRFLSGRIIDNQLRLSSFDGSHVFLFKATLKNDTLKGEFLSGNHWKTNWIAARNDDFKLKSPDSLTYMVKDDFEFNFKTLENKDYIFPNKELKNKVVIVQILGTWCSNCLDETRFYKELYDEYHSEGLEIIGVAYEYPKTFEGKIKRVKQFSNQKDIVYPILIGGNASKAESSADFHMFNSISSFPTSVFLNKNGEVVKIHTGFNGPGTGEIYEEYKKKTKALIEKLLKE
ncbi:TlpA family protein disulfide reductase [Brumimicrobium salinarum]|uniref:TlpA family protein disulfide reductase n=1 Tax=Brumimicrobium salinarum TaxID=2058658 RepID=A0A2I0R6T9_9FLAO|nr:TlpA disulfide reductase family protein [Brumimicrobium salinarum]PKR82090.1 TlpA family protein disulfide reductase [Brumimicrobium salinarum]